MGIEWFRDLSIIISTVATTVIVIVVGIQFLRLYRTARVALVEIKEASMLARDTAEMVHDGVKPIASILSVLRAFGGGAQRSRTTEKRRR